MVPGALCVLGPSSDTLHSDINLLPMHQLPVHKILFFTQPPLPVVAAYASAICCDEGTQLDERTFSSLQKNSAVDLRHWINQCQLGTSSRPAGTTQLQETSRSNWDDVLEKSAHFPWCGLPLRDESQHKALFRSLAKHADDISYLDSRLVLRVDTVSQAPTLFYPQLVEHRRVINGIGSPLLTFGGR